MLRHHRLKLILALLLVGTASMLLAEVLTRILIGRPARLLFGRSWHDEQTDWDLVYGVEADGARITCAPTSAAGEGPRIAVIGDSFVFGQGVADCSDLVSRLSNELPEYRFHNLGLTGGGIREYTLVVRDLVDDYQGALVVFYGNDVGRLEPNPGLLERLARDSSLAALGRKAYHATIVRAARRAWKQAGEGGTEKIALMNGRPNSILSAVRVNPGYYRSMVEPDPQLAAAFRERFETLANLLERRFGRENVLVTVVPQGHTVSRRLRSFILENGGTVAPFGEPGPAYVLIRSLAERHGFHFADVYSGFLPDGDDLYHPHDLHWSAEGHRRMAELLAGPTGIGRLPLARRLGRK